MCRNSERDLLRWARGRRLSFRPEAWGGLNPTGTWLLRTDAERAHARRVLPGLYAEAKARLQGGDHA